MEELQWQKSYRRWKAAWERANCPKKMDDYCQELLQEAYREYEAEFVKKWGYKPWRCGREVDAAVRKTVDLRAIRSGASNYAS